MDLVGKTIGGCELLELVGQGGMGAVYRAMQLSLQREVAVKIMAAQYAENEEFHKRFIREARSIAKVNHPNILQIYEAGASDGIHFMVMEFVSGSSVGARLQEQGFIEWREATQMILQSARGLANAASANIIHRDIKPDNLMLTAENTIKVSDFGLAKECDSELTQTSTVMGTPAYMSPEQCDGDELDTRTDIYSLGGTFYRIVTGVLPFNAPTAVAMIYKQKHEPLIPPEKYMPGISPQVSAVIRKMMAKERQDRYQTMQDVVLAVNQILENSAAPANAEITKNFSKANEFDFAAPPPKLSPGFASQPVTNSIPGGPLRGGETDEVVEAGNGISRMIKEAENFMAQGRSIAAYNFLRKALTLQPDNVELQEKVENFKEESTVACIKIGEGMLAANSMDNIRRELNQILKIDPENIDAIEKLQALEFLEQKKRSTTNDIRKLLGATSYEEALKKWEELHPELREKSLVPTMENVKNRIIPIQKLIDKAQTLNQSGELQQAFEVWEQALQIDDTNDFAKRGIEETGRRINHIENLVREAYELEIKNKNKSAFACYEQILQMVPGHEKAYTKMMVCLKELSTSFEDQGNLEEALVWWEKLLAKDGQNEEARQHIKSIKEQLEELKNQLKNGSVALKKGNYSHAIKASRSALQIQPGNKSAVFHLQKARKSYFYRRVVPLAAVLLIILGIGIYIPKTQRDMLVIQAHNLQTTQDFEQAIVKLKQAGKIPLWGRSIRWETEKKIANLYFLKEHYKLKNAYTRANSCKDGDERAIKDYLKFAEEFMTKLKDNPLLTVSKQKEIKLSILSRIAQLHFKNKKFRQASSAYNILVSFSLSQKIPLAPVVKRRALGLNAWFEGQSDEEAGQNDAALDKYRIAVNNLPDFAPLEKALAAIEKKSTELDSLLQKAGELVVSGSKQKEFKFALKKWNKAKSIAEKVLVLEETNPQALALVREIIWRKAAGPGMVFLKLDEDNALAVDIYEYPNKKGVMPKAVSFFEARKLAKEAGKRLPTLKQWVLIAGGNGRYHRKFPWGNKFAASRCYTSIEGQQNIPVVSGKILAGSTPEGVFDLAGNLAEWVDSGEDDNAREATAMGGHYGSTEPDAVRCSTGKLYPARISSPYIGFRCVRVFTNKMENK